MICPDWNTLTAHRRGAAGSPAASEPEGWTDAMDHFDICTDCRDEAVAADPTLMFRRLPKLEAGADEIADMRAGVAALRRAVRVAEPIRAESSAWRGTGRSSAWWARTAAAAVLASGLLSLQPSLDQPGARAAADARVPDAMAPMAWLDDASGFAVDDIENPTASVYHFDDEEVAVVMVVDAGLDV